MPKSNTVNRMPREGDGRGEKGRTGRKSKQTHSEEEDGERQGAEMHKVADRRS